MKAACIACTVRAETLHSSNIQHMKHVVIYGICMVVSKTMSMLQSMSKKTSMTTYPIKLLCSKPASRVHRTMVAIKSMGPMQWRHGDSQDGPGTRVGKVSAAEAKIEECEGIFRFYDFINRKQLISVDID